MSDGNGYNQNYRIILHDLDPTGPWIGLHGVTYRDGKIREWTVTPALFMARGGLQPDPIPIAAALERALDDVRNTQVIRESDIIADLDPRVQSAAQEIRNEWSRSNSFESGRTFTDSLRIAANVVSCADYADPLRKKAAADAQWYEENEA